MVWAGPVWHGAEIPGVPHDSVYSPFAVRGSYLLVACLPAWVCDLCHGVVFQVELAKKNHLCGQGAEREIIKGEHKQGRKIKK